MKTQCSKAFSLFLLAVGGISPTAHAADRLLLCGGSQVREIEILKDGAELPYRLQWQWIPERSNLPSAMLPKFNTVDDCKPSTDGKEIYVSSSSGAVAIVSYPKGETLFYAAVPNAHSITALPEGFVAAAASVTKEGNRLMLFEREHSDAPVFSLPLEGAHGVTWDASRSVVWALGDKELLRLSLKPETKSLIVEKRYPLEHGGGHDLVLSQDSHRLYLTTVREALVFDIASEKFSLFQELAGLHDVKSLTFHPRTGQMAYTIADPRVWWTYTVRLINPKREFHLESETYKVRWAADQP